MKIEVNGEQVFYGTGSGHADANAQAILFLHGAGMDHTVWVMPARYFARHGFRVIAPDLPGHGMSTGTPLTSIRAMRDWVLAVQDTFNISSSSLVGHSMGSLVSFATTASNPERVDKVALLGTAAPMPVSEGLLGAAFDNHHAAIDMSNTWSHSAAAKLGSSGQPGSWNLNTGMRLLERTANGVYHADLSACNGFEATEFGQVDGTPALVIAGSGDQMTPLRSGLKVAAAIPNSKTIVLDGCGHSMLSEQPNAVLDALALFLSN